LIDFGEKMSIDLTWLKDYIVPTITLAAAIIIGLVLQRFANNRLLKTAQKTKWRGDEIIIKGLRGKIVLWMIIIGLYSVLPMLKLQPQYNELAGKVLLVMVIFSITMVTSSVLGGFIRLYSDDGKSGVLSTSIFAIITRIVIIVIGIMIILQTLDISITPMLTALGVGGLAVALALQDTLSNLFSGFHLLLTRKVRIGDWIELESGEAGHVIDITWRNTTLQQRRNNIIIIPNSTVASSITTNYNLPKSELAIRVDCGVAYDSDLEYVENVTIEVAEDVMKNVRGAVATHKPFVRYTGFGDSSINFYVNLRVEDYGKQFRVRHEFIKRLHKRYNEEGIVIPFPIRTLDIPKESNLVIKKTE